MKFPATIAPWAVGAGAIGTAIVVQRIAARALVIGAPDGHWVYFYIGTFSAETLCPFLVALALAMSMLRLSGLIFQRHEQPTVVAWLAVGLLTQSVLRWYAPASLGSLVISDRANSFYGPTLRYGALDFLSRHAAIVDTLPQHAQANMPGKVMFFYLLELFTAKPEFLGILVLVVSNLGSWLLYMVVRDVLQDRRAALNALVLYLFVPGKLYFFPILNTVTPVLILLCFFLHVRFILTRHWPWALGLGVTLYLLVFFEPLPLVMGILFAVVLGAALFKGEFPVRAALVLGGLATIGFAAVEMMVRIVFQYDLFANLAYVFEDARRFNAAARPYKIWVRQNLYDFVLCVGACAAVLVPVALIEVLCRGGPLRERLMGPVALWALGSLAVLCVLDLTGVNRGEVIRLWIFLACFLQVVPAYLCARSKSLWPFIVVLACALLEGAVGIRMVAFTLP